MKNILFLNVLTYTYKNYFRKGFKVSAALNTMLCRITFKMTISAGSEEMGGFWLKQCTTLTLKYLW